MSILYQKSVLYWILSTNVIIDEIIIKFEDRTLQKVTISDKSILTEFKLFTLSNSGYIYNWECAKPKLNEELLTVKKCIFISISNSIKTTLLNST